LGVRLEDKSIAVVLLDRGSESLQTLARMREVAKATLIIPTLNESLAIRRVLCDMPKESLDVVVVDSSSDDTPEIARSFGVRVIRETRRGYGRALQSGIENAKADIVVFMDGDFTYDPKDVPRIVESILSGRYDVVLGNRLNGKMHPRAMDLVNRVGNTVLSLIFSMLFFKRVNDTQCGLRGIRKRFLEGISYENYGMPYVTEQLIKLVERGARVGNIPVTYRPRIGTTKLCKWTDGFKTLKVILRERFGKYR
jgi:glycosyltransferase involved in cell wall biosynthesis